MRLRTPFARSFVSEEARDKAAAVALCIKNEEYRFPGYEASLKGGYETRLSPVLPYAVSDQEKGGRDTRYESVPRDIIAHICDWNLWWLSHSETALCLMMGDMLAELNEHGFIRLGYVGLRDFCREELGFSGRLGYQLMQIAQKLQKFPLLREAHLKGRINRSALRHILQVVEPETEAAWARIGQMLTVRGLEDKVKSWKKLLSGEAETGDECLRELFGEDISALEELSLRVKESGASDCSGLDDVEKGTWVSVKVPLSQAREWDFARETFSRLSEAELPTGEFIEALLAEYLAAGPLGEWLEELPFCAGHFEASAPGEEKCAGSEVKAQARRDTGLSDQGLLDAFYSNNDKSRSFWRDTQVALEGLSDYWSFLPWKPVSVIVPEELKRNDSWKGNPHLIAEKLKEMEQLRHRIAFHQGRLLGFMWKHQLYNELMFVDISFYARERHGLSSSTVRARITMDERFSDYPLLEKEFLGGGLTLEQVRLLGEAFECGTDLQSQWVDYAKVIPVVELSKTVEKLRDMSEIKKMKWRSLSPWKLHRNRRYEVPQMCAQGKVTLAETGKKELTDGPVRPVRMCAQNDGICAEARESISQGDIDGCQGECARCGESNPVDALVTIRFFLREDLKELWDLAGERFTEQCETGLFDEDSPFRNGPPGLGDFLGELVGAFLKIWVYQHAILPEKVTFRRRIVQRDGWKCSIPGCTCRRNLHVHHIVFRSHGGTDIETICLTLCEAHHLRGVHEGYIIIEGTAPDGLTFLLGYRRDGAPFAKFVNGRRVPLTLHTGSYSANLI